MVAEIPANAPNWEVFNLTGLVAVITGGGSGETEVFCSDAHFLAAVATDSHDRPRQNVRQSS
jgi:hypothetical protein